MATNIGIWIDHRKAVITTATADRIITKTIYSRLSQHPHYAGSQDGGGERKYEERFRQGLNRFFDAVAGHIGHPDALFIFGPGEAKHELKARLVHANAIPAEVVDLEAADDLTDPQIIAKVKVHFGLDIVRLSS
jgi:hypothetical protein